MDQFLPQHPNGMRLTIFDEHGDMIATNEYYSVGGGFVIESGTQFRDNNAFFRASAADPCHDISEKGRRDIISASLPFKNGEQLLKLCKEKNMTISEIVLQNELKWRPRGEIYSGLMVFFFFFFFSFCY